MQRHLHSANCHLLAVPRCRLNTYGRQAFSVADPMAWNSPPDFIRDPTSSKTVLDVHLKRTCSRVTSASSALRVFNDYALYKSTQPLTHSRCGYSVDKIGGKPKRLLPNLNVLVAISKSMWAVKLCTSRILLFLTGGAS